VQPFILAAELERRYSDYIRTAFPFADPKLREQIDRKIREEHLLASGPIVSLQRAFAPGPSVAELEASGRLDPLVARIFKDWELHRHQADALGRLSDRTGSAKSTIVATGTGSGKTEAFLLPILDFCARTPGEGVKALLVYPMNALANDQLNRLRGYLRGTGITFGRYTGDTRENEGEGRPDEAPPEECWSRAEIRRRRPNLLITSYRMLEYLLVRRQDQPIFRPGGAPSSLRYLVLDEVHTYEGALGAEVACLVRRLRGHLDLEGSALVCVGTSATVGNDQGDAVCAFASELFADTVDRAGLIEERYAEDLPPPSSLPSPPALTDEQLVAIERLGEQSESEPVELDSTLTAAVDACVGARSWPQDWAGFERALFDALHDQPTLRWLQHSLRAPARLDDVVAASLAIPGREGVNAKAAQREITALLTLGTIARDAEGALLRPRLHAFFRGLARTTRCVFCGDLQANGDGVCSTCHGRALPLEICRICGQDYLRLLPLDPHATLSDGTLTRTETEDEARPTGPTVLRLTHTFHKFADEADEDEDDGTSAGASPPPPPHNSHRICYCVDCGFLNDPLEGAEAAAGSPCRHCGSDRLATPLLVGQGRLMACPNCHGRYGNQEPITGLFSSTAVGVSILTWILMGRLREAERRLLIFADSRQDTAYQAGYLADVTAEYAWRQVTYRMAQERHESGDIAYDFNGFWKKLYQFGLERYAIFSRDDREQQNSDLRWFLLKEFGRESRRRNALEQLGLVTCEYRGIEEIERHDATFQQFRRAARAKTERPVFTDEGLQELLVGVLDIVRRSGALSEEYALKFWGQNEPLRGLDDINRRPVIFRKFGGGKSGYANIRPFAGTSARRTAIEEVMARAGVDDPRAAAAAAADLLLEAGLLVKVKAGGPQAHQKTEGLAVNIGRVALTIPAKLWQCVNCRGVSARPLLGLCVSANCPDWHSPSLRTFVGKVADDNFYAAMYASFDPIRIEAREHSGQIGGDRRMEYEEQFRVGKINVLVASPTLELGVDIGGLSTVLLRGLPPSPANYAQRAGRAGRSERIALVNAYAQTTPHDAYFFRYPDRMISGTIGVPSFDLDNQEIVRRHIRALALEKLVTPLPAYMREFLDISDVDDPSPDQFVTSKVVGAGQSMVELSAKRDAIINAVSAVFAADKREWLSAAYVRDVLESFESDLMRVLDRWHSEVVEVALEIGRINKIANPSAEEKRRRQQFERTLGALTRRAGMPGGGGSAESYTLGYLSSHGFLPSYAFPGEAATLFAPEIEGGEVSREPSIAISEFAPENIVYVDGRKILCDGITLPRTSAATASGADPSSYVRCDKCGFVASKSWTGSCPSCGAVDTASRQARIEAIAYRGRQFERIGAGEDARQRRIYQVKPKLMDRADFSERFDYVATTVTLFRRQPLMNINEGRIIDGTPVPFEICMECGDVSSPIGDWISRHRKRRGHEPKLQATHLTNTLKSDVVAIEPFGLSEAACLTLRYALLAAASLEFDAGERELGGFEDRAPFSGNPRTLLYERVAGGVGYVRRIPADMPRLAGRALELLNHETPCVKACYLCLKSYYNQRDHELIDKVLIVDFLEAVSREKPVVGYPLVEGAISGPDAAVDTDWELRLLRGLEECGLKGAVAQFEVREPVDGRLVTKPDIAFPTERIAVYADGDAHHTSPEDRAHDLRVRTRARELGWKIKVFSNARIAKDLDGCVSEIQRIFEEA
jgi:very-short-patch-repair endonuclease